MRPVPMLTSVGALMRLVCPSIRPRLARLLAAVTVVMLLVISPVAALVMFCAVRLKSLPACSLPLLTTSPVVLNVRLLLATSSLWLVKSLVKATDTSPNDCTLPSPLRLAALMLARCPAMMVPAVLVIDRVLTAELSCTVAFRVALIRPWLLLMPPELAVSVTLWPAMLPAELLMPLAAMLTSCAACRVPLLLMVWPVVVVCKLPWMEARTPRVLSRLLAVSCTLPLAAICPPALLAACSTVALKLPAASTKPKLLFNSCAAKRTSPPLVMRPAALLSITPWLVMLTLPALVLLVPAGVALRACTLPRWLVRLCAVMARLALLSIAPAVLSRPALAAMLASCMLVMRP